MKSFLVTFCLCLIIVIGFFYKTVLNKQVPFPGDLLIAEYNPWKTYSYLGYNPGSYPNKAQYFDTLRQIYPWKTFVVNSFKNNSFPLWNPHNFSGSPLMANFQSAVFYPFNFMYLVFPQIWVWSSLVMLQPFLALVFTFFYARKIGIGRLGSDFASISFSFSSFMTVWLEYNTIGHVILWLPLSLLAIEMLLKKITIIWMVIFTASIVFALFAGHPQIFIYSLIFILAYLIFRIFSLRKINTEKIKGFLFFFLLLVLAIGIGAIQIIPGIELIKESARSPHDYSFLIQKILIQPWQFIMIVVPDFFGNPATRNYWPEDTYIGKVTYIGIIPLFFVLLSFKNLKKSFIFFFTVAGGLILLLSSFNPITAIIYKLNLPFISSSAPTLSIFLFCFCVSILSGFGIDIYRSEKWNVARISKFVAPLIFVILFLWIAVLFIPDLISDRLLEHITVAKRNLLYASFLVGAGTVLILAAKAKKNVMFFALILLFIIQTGDLFRYFTKFNPFVPKELVFPKADVLDFLKTKSGIDRFWGYGSANIEANFATQYRLFSTDGYDPLYPKRYGELIQSSLNGKLAAEFTRQTRSDAFIAPGSGEDDLPSNIYRLKILDLLGVKYILDRVENGSTEKTFPKDRFKLIYEKDGWKVFENKKAAPRVFLTDNYKVFSTKEEFKNIFFAESFVPSRTVILEEDLRDQHFNDSNHRSSVVSVVEVVSYTPNKVEFKTNAEGDRLLFLSDIYYPGWKAYVDGKKTKIYRANYSFRAVLVPEGKHEVVMKYEPDSFKMGYAISLMSVILLLVLISYFFTVNKKRYNKRNEK